MEHHGGIFRFLLLFLVDRWGCRSAVPIPTQDHQGRMSCCCFFLAGIQEKVRMIRCNFSCNWAGTIWIRIWKGLNKQMVDVIYSNSFFFCHLYILNLSSRSSSFFPGDFANWWIQKRHLLRWGQFFLRGGCCLGMGWILIFTAKVETETFSKAWYQHKEELQQGREQASDFMLPLHRTLSIFFSQFWTDLKQTWPPGHPANVGHWRAGEYFNGPGGMS